MKKLISLIIVAISFINLAQSQNTSKYWKAISEKEIVVDGIRQIIPKKYLAVALQNNELKKALFAAPHERTVLIKNSSTVIELPLPNGTFQKFSVVEAPVMGDGLSSKFPFIKTFSVHGIDDPYASGKLDWNSFGFHGMISTPSGDFFIDPYTNTDVTNYITYYTLDFEKDPSQRVPEAEFTGANLKKEIKPNSVSSTMICAGDILRIYRLVIACTGEYAQAATGLTSPTIAQTLSRVVTTVNRVDGVYEKELDYRMVLIDGDTVCLFTNPNTDPFTGNSNASILIGESQTVIDARVADTDYDMGHTFSTGGGGLSSLGVVCQSGNKASSITGSPSPVGDPYDIDYVAHEMGHETGANHTFNSVISNCGGGNRNAGTAIEPGSGITIMAYAGICGSDDLSAHSIPYFSTISFDEIIAYTQTNSGNSCPAQISTGNHAPVVTGSATYTVPANTPFVLTGSGIDPDGDSLTFSWEEFDKGAVGGPWNSGTTPYFRPFSPVTSRSRSFPLLPNVLAGNMTGVLGEVMPSTAQTLNFRLTARDNKMGGGGVCYAASQVVVASGGPFNISYPNVSGITWASASTQTITWNVNSTNLAPISCDSVKISISYNSGNTFTTLVAATLNDGTEAITVPTRTVNTTTCRVKIEAVRNIFYDVNDKNFTISALVGIDEYAAQANSVSMQLIPNPANEQVVISLSGLSKTQKSSLTMYDIIGNVVLKDELLAKENQEVNYDIASLSKGVYVVEITNASQKVVKRLIKQ
ncbi:MAG TPA: zinc-dependent metalloprotease family protein [Bacteroidia bacterium]|nr:zinc-dependent metalloprotease family protein [Bacteroidia bacterium]